VAIPTEMDEMAEMGAMAGEMQAAGDEMQAMLDDELPSIRGMFSETAINALVDAANAALEAGGFDGDYPEFTEDVTEFPGEFIRLLAMLADAAEESGAAVDLSMDGIEDDRDVAMLASQLKQLASDERFVSMMSEAPEVEASVTVSPGGEVDEETLMMERM
jgi:hypothetical protein